MLNQAAVSLSSLMQKDEVFNEATDDSFRNAVAVMPLFARSVAAELREASDQVGEPDCMLSSLSAAQTFYATQPSAASSPQRPCMLHLCPFAPLKLEML